jgi:hypothetical protein
LRRKLSTYRHISQAPPTTDEAVDSSIASQQRASPSEAQSPAMSYFFSTPVDIDIVLEDLDDRSAVDVKLDKNRKEKVPLYLDGESVKGQVTVRPKDGKRLEHTGIKVQFIGTIGAWPPCKSP